MSMYYSQWADRPQDDSDTSGDVRVKQEATDRDALLEPTRSSKRRLPYPNHPPVKWKKGQKDPDTSTAGCRGDPSMSMATMAVLPAPTTGTSSNSNSHPLMAAGVDKPIDPLVSNFGHSIND